MSEAVVGLDLGTQGVRALAVTERGEVLGAAHEGLAPSTVSLPAGWFEQDPRDWRRAAAACLRGLCAGLPAGTQVVGISVDSTSGTILPVDRRGEPLHPALMYNDGRSESQVARVRAAGRGHEERFGFRFGSSYGLPKMAWFQAERPEVYAQTARFLHAADYLVGVLSGNFQASDTSNALKSGYDLLDFRWPDFIPEGLGISADLLPEVAGLGARVGAVSAAAAVETGLPAGTPVFAGATDGTAAQIASGAARPGDWNTTLGTTLVFKGVTRTLQADPFGRVYFHRHPEGWWMPGGASNTGADWIPAEHPGADPAALDRAAEECLPTRLLRYPLLKQGERFPFVRPEARGFTVGDAADGFERYAAGLEGVAMIERLSYETLAAIGLEVGERIYLTGGGARSALWSRLRAAILNKILVVPAVTETAFGAAVIAASGCWHGSISAAAGAMVRAGQTVAPDPAWRERYDERYALFQGELRKRGYLEAGA